MKVVLIRSFILVVLFSLLTACGQSGRLYLPSEESHLTQPSQDLNKT